MTTYLGKSCSFGLPPSIYVFSYFPFGFEGRMWDLIVSVPDNCLSFYFEIYDTSFYFHFYFKPLKNTRKELLHLISCNLLRRICEKFNSFSCFNSFQIQSHKK